MRCRNGARCASRCFVLALLLSYSGTGLLALVHRHVAAAQPQDAGARRRWRWAAAALVFWLLGDALNLSFTLGRASEFDSERSSGYIRYIAPLHLLLDAARADPAQPVARSRTGHDLPHADRIRVPRSRPGRS